MGKYNKMTLNIFKGYMLYILPAKIITKLLKVENKCIYI